MYKQTYRLGPLNIELTTIDQAQHQQIMTGWRHLFRIDLAASPTPTEQTIYLRLEPTAAAMGATALSPQSLLSTQGVIQIGQTANGLQCCCGATMFQIDPVQPQAVGYVAADFWNYALVEQRSFWQTLFFLLVRRTGCALLHANALYPEALGPEAGVLFVGDCGSGKTSLTLSLITAGWRYVTDDTVLLQPSKPVDAPPAGPVRSLQAYAVRRGFACTEQTVAQWPWLAALATSGAALNRQKTLIDLDSRYTTSFAPICSPRALFFPRRNGAAQSQMHALTRTQSFTALLGQSHNGLLVEPAFTPPLLTLFHALVEQTCSYQLDLGWDVFTAPAQVSALLTSVLPTGSENAS
ncbi:MAG: hypothetical protein U0350_11560 [Caldilineaceae bacterium]